MSEKMLAVARTYLAAGLSVIPIRHGSKEPDHQLLEQTTGEKINWVPSSAQAAWRTYCTRRPTDAELIAWFGDSDAGIGIVGGAISGGLVRIDFEHDHCLPTWRQQLRADSEAREAIAKLPIVTTPKGNHVYFRMADPPGHVLLSTNVSNLNETSSELLVLAETQGEGCYCVAPPSVWLDWEGATWQPARKPYHLLYGDLTSIPLLSTELASKLLAAARFTDFWTHRLHDYSTSQARVHRGGITLERTIAGHQESWYLPWEAVSSLRNYLADYAPLLKVIETAPPPPPSYEDYEDIDGD